MNAAAKRTADAIADHVTADPSGTAKAVLAGAFVLHIAALLWIGSTVLTMSTRLTRLETLVDGYRSDVNEMRTWMRRMDDRSREHKGD